MQKLLLFLALLFLTGCSSSTLNGDAKDFHPLWNYDTLPNGFKVINQNYMCKFKDGQNTVNIGISPSKYRVIKSTLGDLEKKVHYKGIDYIVFEAAAAWDARDDIGNWIGGTIYEKNITWKKDGFIFSIGASTQTGDEGNDFITVELASTINFESIKTMKKYEEQARAEFKSEEGLDLSIVIKDVEKGNKSIEDYQKDTKFQKLEETRLTFYIYKNPSGYSKSIFCMPPNKFYEFRAGIPWGLQTEELRDAVDFLNVKYAYQIIEEIG